MAIPTSSWPWVRRHGGQSLLRSVDGGTTWQAIPVQVTPGLGLRTVRFRDSNVGIALGDGEIIRTTDGGLTWQRVWYYIDSQNVQRLGALSFDWLDANTLVGVGVATVLRSTDAGLTWQTYGSDTPYADNVDFADAQVGIGTSGSSPAVRTTDGGLTWSPVGQGVFVDPVLRIASVGSGIWLAAGGTGIYRSTDNGVTWTRTNHPGKYLLGLRVHGSTAVVTGMDGVVMRSDDAGLTWDRRSRPRLRPALPGRVRSRPDGLRGWHRRIDRPARRVVSDMQTHARPAVVRNSLLLLALAAGLMLAGCGGGSSNDDGGIGTDPPTPPATGTLDLQLWPAKMALDVGASNAALVFGATGAAAFASSDPAVATIDAAGTVTALARGTTTITATVGDRSVVATVRVFDAASATSPDATRDALIAAALTAGRIDTEQALVYRVYAAYGDPRLPAEYEGAPGGDTGSIQMRAVSARWPTLSAATRATLQPFFVPPIYVESWLGRQLGLAPVAGAAVAADLGRRHALADEPAPINCVSTFPSEYLARASTANFNVFSVKVFNDSAQADVDRLAGSLEATYEKETGLLGGRVPKSDQSEGCNGGDRKVDIYIAPLADKFAVTTAYPGRCKNTPAFMVVNQNRLRGAYQTAAGDATRLAALDKAYANILAHEMLHVFQLGMERSASCEDYAWIDEATAEWVMDHVFPDDNMEDWIPSWATNKRRAGGFFTNYVVNGHLDSIERGGADSVADLNGYSDYVFFQFVARTYGAETISAIFDAMALHGSVEAIDAGLQAQGGMKAVWPLFARAMWLDPENTGLPSVLGADGYDFGIDRVFEGVAASYQTKAHSHDNVVVGPAGGARMMKTLLGAAAIFGGGFEVPARSFVYEHLKFDDDNVSSFLLFNPVALSGSDGIRVEVVRKIGGQWQAPRDITRELYVSLCRDKRDDRVQEIILIVSNGRGERDAAPLVITDDKPMQVSASNVGCFRWQGTSEYRLEVDTPTLRTTFVGQAVNLVFDALPATAPLTLESELVGSASFVSTAGAARSSQDSVQGSCTLTSAGALTPLGQTPGSVDGAMSFNLDLSDPLTGTSPDRLLIGAAIGTTLLPTTTTVVCPGVNQTSTATQAATWLTLRAGEPFAINPDGRTISSTQVGQGPLPGSTYTTKVNMTAVRE